MSDSIGHSLFPRVPHGSSRPITCEGWHSSICIQAGRGVSHTGQSPARADTLGFTWRKICCLIHSKSLGHNSFHLLCLPHLQSTLPDLGWNPQCTESIYIATAELSFTCHWKEVILMFYSVCFISLFLELHVLIWEKKLLEKYVDYKEHLICQPKVRNSQKKIRIQILQHQWDSALSDDIQW